MTDHGTGAGAPAAPARDTSLGEALKWRLHHSGFTSRSRVGSGLLALVALTVIHLGIAVLAGHPWSWLAVVLNPPAFYLVLRGWAFMDVAWFAGGLALGLVGSFLPFYLM